MPAPSRDRLSRPVDISTLFRGAARRVDLIVDEPGLRYTGLSGNPNPVASGSRVTGRRGGVQDLGLGDRWNFHRFPRVGRENRTPVTIARRGGRSVLPHWYPRTPLRDITGIARAIEIRREELQHDEDQDQPSGTSLENNNAISVFGPHTEHHEVGASTPLPTILMKPRSSPIARGIKVRDVITREINREDPDFLTPQKKLLNSIERVREVWLEEQKKLENTPAAKRAKRERKVRVLLSMR